RRLRSGHRGRPRRGGDRAARYHPADGGVHRGARHRARRAAARLLARGGDQAQGSEDGERVPDRRRPPGAGRRGRREPDRGDGTGGTDLLRGTARRVRGDGRGHPSRYQRLPGARVTGARTPLGSLGRFGEGVSIAIERGTPLADVLRAQAQDAREEAKRELMETAGQREIMMLVPVVFFVLPLVIVFAIFPGLAVLEISL